MIFPIIRQWEVSFAMATTVLMESAPKLKNSLSPIPLMLLINLIQVWPTDLGDSIISLSKFNPYSRAGNSEVTVLIWPEFEFEILCLTWLRASLTKIGSKLKVLALL